MARRKPVIEVICVGSELLQNRVNTHTVSIGSALSSIGLSIAREHVVGDDPGLMREVFSESFKRADIVICSGGLGPTFDDLTREMWSKVTRRSLRFHGGIVSEIRRKFRQRGYAMPPANRRQGFILSGADRLSNALGTAPGQYLEHGRKVLILLPGPKIELEPMLIDSVMPRLKAKLGLAPSAERAFHLFGVPESVIDERLRPLIARLRKERSFHLVFGILASGGVITVKFRVEGSYQPDVDGLADRVSSLIRPTIAEYIFAEGEETIGRVVGNRLRESESSLAVAESCTGGLIAKLITDEPGASDYFVEGAVTYANRAKERHLGVRSSTLQRYGAVSERTAREMALGMKKRAGTTFAVSSTGVAGPGGSTPEKPVGLVYVACAGPRRTVVETLHLRGDRARIRQRAAFEALILLHRELKR